MNGAPCVVVDVRRDAEFLGDRVTGAINVPLDYLNEHLAEIPKDQAVYVYCAGGYRSMIAISILKARGWNNLIDVEGGMKSLQATSLARSRGQTKSQLAN
jgi:rhodanese-related sulfurtransferase